MNTSFKQNDLILFTGDSITDCHRNRQDPGLLGMGYAGMVAGRLGLNHAELNLRFRNTGISGDRTCDLLARWDADCIDLRPDWVSILVGINNTLRRYDSLEPTPIEVFAAEYRKLLERVQGETDARLVLCSPFLLHTDSAVERMREDLDPKIAVIKQLAEEFDAIWVDFDAAFAAAQQRHIPSYWAGDGVHPSASGHALMADSWIGIVDG
jgi:lysophospholipase L1-like esterase